MFYLVFFFLAQGTYDMPCAWAIITIRATFHLPIILEMLRVTDPGDYTKAMLDFVHQHHNMSSYSLIEEYCPMDYLKVTMGFQRQRPPSRRSIGQGQGQQQPQGQGQQQPQGQGQQQAQGQGQQQAQGQGQQQPLGQGQQQISVSDFDSDSDSGDDEIVVIPDKGRGFFHTYRRYCPPIITPYRQRGPKRKRV